MAGVGSDPPFLSVSVTEPVKMGAGMQAYISYRVSTKVRHYIYHWLGVYGLKSNLIYQLSCLDRTLNQRLISHSIRSGSRWRC